MKILDLLSEFFAGWKKKNEKLMFWQVKEEREWMRWVIIGVLVAVLVPMFPRGRSLQFADMTEGSISTREILAPFDFEILKTPEEYNQDRDLAQREVYPIFIRAEDRLEEIQASLDVFFNEVENIRKQLTRTPALRASLMDSLFLKYPISFPDARYRAMLVDPRGMVRTGDLRELKRYAYQRIRDFLAVGVLDQRKERFTTPDRRMILKDADEDVIHPFDDFYDLSEVRERPPEENVNNGFRGKSQLVQMGDGIFHFFMRPNLMYDEETHRQRIADAVARVPLASGFVKKTEKIVGQNERITSDVRKKLVSLATKQAEMGMQEGGIRRLFPLMGKVGFVFLLLLSLGVFMAWELPNEAKEIRSTLLIAIVIFLVSLITFLVHRLNGSEYLVPAALGAILLATLFDTKFGYAGAVVISVLVGGLWGNEFNLTVVSFFVGIVGVITIRRVRDRRQLVQMIFYLICAYIIVITTMGLLRFFTFRDIVKQYPYGAISGLAIPIVAYGLLPLIESVFDITTDFSLLELSNLNHPLLKRLSTQAPGTYHHSIIVGNLAEAASQAVGANSLMARVGSYYHDVGKIEKAEYFVENQVSGENPHEKLTPRMSALILMNHVKKGLELAEKYKLPASIKNIIAQHQGTTVMSFFYRKAVKKNETGEANKEDYRYPGPRPQSKEAAIVMLSDAVEAATRSLKEPTHSRLKGLIGELVDARFQEGQLDESPLTLKDLERIKETFLTILAGTFHARVEYPEIEEQKVASKPRDQKESIVKD
jgi:putative nucleotidyltransferase with HDIG domain